MPYVAICLYGPHVSKMPTIDVGLTEVEVDAKFGFHESSFTEFPEEEGVRSFADPDECSNEFLVADHGDVDGLIGRVSDEIVAYEELLDDVDEEGSDEFDLFTKKSATLRKIVQQLKQL